MSSDVRDFLRRTRDSDIAQYNKIRERLQEIQEHLEEDLDQEKDVLARHARLKTTSVTVGEPNIIAENLHHHQTALMMRKKPLTVKSYPLVHVVTGSVTWKARGHRRGGNGIFDGSSYITVSDHARLNVTDEIGIALGIKPPAASADHIIVSKLNQYQLKLADPNKIQWRIYSGGSWKTAVEYTYTPGTWIDVIATYKSTGSGQKLYIGGTLEDSDSETGALNTSANDLKIGGDGTANLPNNTALSWLTILHKELDSTWRDNYVNKSLLDTSGANVEITTIPFQGDADPRPDATSGLCRST